MGCGWRCCGRWLRLACALRCLSETAKVTTIAMRIHPMRAGASAVVARRLRTDQNSSGGVLAAEALDVPGIARDDPLGEPRSAEVPVACGPGRRWHAHEAPERTAAMNPGRRRTASSGGAPWFAGNARPADERVADMNPCAVPRGARAIKTRNKLAARRLGGAGPRPAACAGLRAAAGPPPPTRPRRAARRPEAVRAATGPVPGGRPGRARPGAAPRPGGRGEA